MLRRVASGCSIARWLLQTALSVTSKLITTRVLQGWECRIWPGNHEAPADAYQPASSPQLGSHRSYCTVIAEAQRPLISS